MKQLLIDTNAYVAFKRGNPEAAEILRIPDLIGMSTVVLGELLGGFALGKKDAENRKELDAFLNLHRMRILPVDELTAGHYAAVYRQLRSKGKPIPTNDLWIAATALQNGYAVFTYDPHFSHIEGLRSGHRVSDFIF